MDGLRTDLDLAPGSLWARALETTRRALRSGALQPIATAAHVVRESGVSFVVREVANLERKARARRDRGAGAPIANPFLPYEEELFVADVSATHVCLLNKYNVVDHHLLLVTRRFEEQSTRLGLADFEALWRGLVELESVGFYNSGPLAGASQPHRHLQLVPAPLGLGPEGLPIERLLDSRDGRSGVCVARGLPFANAIVSTSGLVEEPPSEAASVMLALYERQLDALGLGGDSSSPAESCRPYNLLVTREWMLLIPRRAAAYRSIEVNALGFAGALLVRNAQDLETVRGVGPFAVLQHAAHPPMDLATSRGGR